MPGAVAGTQEPTRDSSASGVPGRRCMTHAIANAAATAIADPVPDFTLRIGPVTVEPFKGKLVRTLGYNGSVPGPLFRVPEGNSKRDSSHQNHFD